MVLGSGRCSCADIHRRRWVRRDQDVQVGGEAGERPHRAARLTQEASIQFYPKGEDWFVWAGPANAEVDEAVRQHKDMVMSHEYSNPDGPWGKGHRRVWGTKSDVRKLYPLARGLLDYFPDALAEVAKVSWAGNEKHNPGQPMHHARGKSSDHADCIMRHLAERGNTETLVVGNTSVTIRHTAELAWRALALLQEELEAAGLADMPRAAREARADASTNVPSAGDWDVQP